MMMACFARPFRHAMGEEGECSGAGGERSESGKWGVAYRPHRVNECASRCVRFNSFRDYLLPVSPPLCHPPSIALLRFPPSSPIVVKMSGCKSSCVRSWKNFLGLWKANRKLHLVSLSSKSAEKNEFSYLHFLNSTFLFCVCRCVCVWVCALLVLLPR